MHSFGYITHAFRHAGANHMHYYSFDVDIIKVVPTPALVPSASALIDSRSIPRTDSRLLIASTDPPIGTPIQKVGGSSTLEPLIYFEVKRTPHGWFAFRGPWLLLNFWTCCGSEFRTINEGGRSRRGR